MVPKPFGQTESKAFLRCSGRGLTANLEDAGTRQGPGEHEETMHPARAARGADDMTTSMVPDLGSLSFWRIAAVPFDTYVAALDSWLPAKHGGELWFGGSQLLAPIEHDRDLGTRRIQVRLA